MNWIRVMLGRTCEKCGGRKPLFTHVCDDCWEPLMSDDRHA